jgi:hypothetical protein
VAKTVNLANTDISNDRMYKRLSLAFNQKCDILENVNVPTFRARKPPVNFL